MIRNKCSYASFVVLSLAFIGLIISPFQARAQDQFVGDWQGVIYFVPAEIEVDFSVTLQKTHDNQWAGFFNTPINYNASDRLLEKIVISGSNLSFTHKGHPGNGVFRGRIASDAQSITGRFDQFDKDHDFRFELVKKAAENPAQPEIHPLSADGHELKELFNSDQGEIRLMIILSPTCHMCRQGARLVQKHVLNKIEDKHLKVYLVWLPILDADDETAARDASLGISDPRVKHYWTKSHEMTDTFKGHLGFIKSTAWDIFMVFSPKQRWGDESPNPTFYMHRHDELPDQYILNGQKLSEFIQIQLETR